MRLAGLVSPTHIHAQAAHISMLYLQAQCLQEFTDDRAALQEQNSSAVRETVDCAVLEDGGRYDCLQEDCSEHGLSLTCRLH